MSALSAMALDLLCHLTFAPDSRQISEETEELVGSCWQTLINDLSDPEKDQIIALMRERVSYLENSEMDLQDHEIAELESLTSFIEGEMT